MNSEDDERNKAFHDVLFGKSEEKCACAECNYTRKIEGKPGEYEPCKIGHKAGKNVKICDDCSKEMYHTKKK